MLPDAWGIHASLGGRARRGRRPWRPETVELLRAAMGSTAGRPRAPGADRRPGAVRDLGLGPGRGRLRGRRPAHDRRRRPRRLPVRLPPTCDAGGRTRRLIVSPGRCWLPEGWRAWGWAVQLYAARSRPAGGSATCADLAAIRRVGRGPAPASCSSTRCTPSRRRSPRRRAPTCRRPGASATRSTCASRTSRAATRPSVAASAAELRRAR